MRLLLTRIVLSLRKSRVFTRHDPLKPPFRGRRGAWHSRPNAAAAVSKLRLPQSQSAAKLFALPGVHANLVPDLSRRALY